MKKIILVLFLGVLFSCSSEPEKSVKKFLESSSKGDINEAKKIATKSTGKALDLLGRLGQDSFGEDFKFKILKDSIVGDKAWVMYAGTKHGKKYKETLELVLVEGKWLVSIE